MTARYCEVCAAEHDLRELHHPSVSGPGWAVVRCSLCVRLPADPEHIPASVTAILMRRAGRT